MTSLTVNGQPVHYEIDPETELVWALRDTSMLRGTKFGCRNGLCGACTVLVDGRTVRSCQVTIAAVEGRAVTTIEGIPAGRDHPLQREWLAENLPRCGFCQSGMIVAAVALLAETPTPSDDDIDAAITNHCRCHAFHRIRRVIRRAAASMPEKLSDR
jgi:isoquinoline 1-oxidoreductase alpha subunit